MQAINGRRNGFGASASDARLRIGRMRNLIDGVSRQELSTGRRSHVMRTTSTFRPHIFPPHRWSAKNFSSCKAEFKARHQIRRIDRCARIKS
jgi:hypothetical protein